MLIDFDESAYGYRPFDIVYYFINMCTHNTVGEIFDFNITSVDQIINGVGADFDQDSSYYPNQTVVEQWLTVYSNHSTEIDKKVLFLETIIN